MQATRQQPMKISYFGVQSHAADVRNIYTQKSRILFKYNSKNRLCFNKKKSIRNLYNYCSNGFLNLHLTAGTYVVP